jgi:hypothetical protein
VDTIQRFRKGKIAMLQGAAECDDDDEDSVAHMMLWETKRRAAALPPLGQVIATIFAAECREVERIWPRTVHEQSKFCCRFSNSMGPASL